MSIGGSLPADDGWRLRFGRWTAEELGETLRDSTGAGSDQDVADGSRFVRGVAQLVRRREAMDRDSTDPRTIAIFILAPNPPDRLAFKRDPLLYMGRTSLAGKIWCVNAAVRMGWGANLTTSDANEMFLTVTEELELGDHPAIIVDPRLGMTEVHHYPNGLSVPDSCEGIRLHATDVDIVSLSSVVERIYQRHLKTPSAQPQATKLWKRARDHRPHRHAEHRIQALLLPAFTVRWPTCRVWHEFAGTMGRADIHITEHDPVDQSRLTHLAVLELKVLRSFSETGEEYLDGAVRAGVEEGIKQAGAYREEHGHRVAALCCFDMRDEDTGEECFSAWRTLATKKDVALRRWYLFASSKLARDA